MACFYCLYYKGEKLIAYDILTQLPKRSAKVVTREEFVTALNAAGITDIPSPPEPAPTEEEQLRADVDFLLAMGGYVV